MSKPPAFLPLQLNRILDLALLVESGELDAAARADISRALFFYLGDLQTRIASQKRGRRTASDSWGLALAAKTLVQDHDVSVKAAVAALLPRGNKSDMARVTRAYQKLTHKSGLLPPAISVERKTIDAALARLAKPSGKRTGKK